jgi:hypothetical protein
MPDAPDQERADLLQALAGHRHFLRYTTRDLNDEQAAKRTTVSALCLGGLIKHVSTTERQWAKFIIEGPAAMSFSEEAMAGWASIFAMVEGDTLAGLLAEYERVAQQTGSSWLRCPTWMPPIRCRRRPGSRLARVGRPGACCCISSPKRPSTPGTPTSSANRWTAPRRWRSAPACRRTVADVSQFCRRTADHDRNRPRGRTSRDRTSPEWHASWWSRTSSSLAGC